MQKNNNRYSIECLKEEFQLITGLELLDEGVTYTGKNNYATLLLNTENAKYLEGNIELPNIDNINLLSNDKLKFYQTLNFIPAEQNQLRIVGFKFAIPVNPNATTELKRINYVVKIN